MPWRLRKVFKTGPFRWSLSRRGVGVSWGFPGFRIGVSADGRYYVSVGIPGTGLYYFHHFGRRRYGASRGSSGQSPPVGPTPGGGSLSVTPPPKTSIVLPITTSAPVPRARLVVKRSAGSPQREYHIAQAAVVGKGPALVDMPDVDLANLPDAARISPRHAEIHYVDGMGWVIRDLGSQFGTFIRQSSTSGFRRVVGQEVLRDGDEVSFGNATFIFRAD